MALKLLFPYLITENIAKLGENKKQRQKAAALY